MAAKKKKKKSKRGRSAKQLANDARLGRMAKARAGGAKRGSSKRKGRKGSKRSSGGGSIGKRVTELEHFARKQRVVNGVFRHAIGRIYDLTHHAKPASLKMLSPTSPKRLAG